MSLGLSSVILSLRRGRFFLFCGVQCLGGLGAAILQLELGENVRQQLVRGRLGRGFRFGLLFFLAVEAVDDLHHLQRGGRISKTTAIVGSIINIKPLLKVTAEGKLEAAGSVRGRKKSIATLVSQMESNMTEEWKPLNTTIAIAHANCPDEAASLAQTIKDKFGIKNVVINDINPSIGVHSGPGAIPVSYTHLTLPTNSRV